MLALRLLRLAGLFPREIHSSFIPAKEGRQVIHRVGRVSLGFTLLSVSCFVARIVLINILVVEFFNIFSNETIFDIFGSVLWVISSVISELLTAVSVAWNNKKLKYCFNKISFLNCVYWLSKEQLKPFHSQKLAFSSVFVSMFCSVVWLVKVNSLSFFQIAVTVYKFISNFLFLVFCCSVTHNLAVLQASVQNIDPFILDKLLSANPICQRNFENKMHPSRYSKSIEYSASRQGNFGKCSLAVHLRMQQVVDSSVATFMDAVGIGILIQIGEIIVSITLGMYFIIKAVFDFDINQIATIGVLMGQVFTCYQFSSMSTELNKEVSENAFYIIENFK